MMPGSSSTTPSARKVFFLKRSRRSESDRPNWRTSKSGERWREERFGVRGTILAVNQAYNFVVLSLSGRNGVEPHSEMLIVRDGTFIGKIRISSVEPATAIGDIVTSTLARGVQVQPGDIIIYAGSNS